MGESFFFTPVSEGRAAWEQLQNEEGVIWWQRDAGFQPADLKLPAANQKCLKLEDGRFSCLSNIGCKKSEDLVVPLWAGEGKGCCKELKIVCLVHKYVLFHDDF